MFSALLNNLQIAHCFLNTGNVQLRLSCWLPLCNTHENSFLFLFFKRKRLSQWTYIWDCAKCLCEIFALLLLGGVLVSAIWAFSFYFWILFLKLPRRSVEVVLQQDLEFPCHWRLLVSNHVGFICLHRVAEKGSCKRAEGLQTLPNTEISHLLPILLILSCLSM